MVPIGTHQRRSEATAQGAEVRTILPGFRDRSLTEGFPKGARQLLSVVVQGCDYPLVQVQAAHVLTGGFVQMEQAAPNWSGLTVDPV